MLLCICHDNKINHSVRFGEGLAYYVDLTDTRNISRNNYAVKPKYEKFFTLNYFGGNLIMDGRLFARVIERELAKREISKGKFYEDLGITATAMYGWKRGAEPKRETVSAVEKYFNITVPNVDSPKPEAPDTTDLMQMIRERQELRILLRSADGLPTSSVYELIARVEKMKEDAQ